MLRALCPSESDAKPRVSTGHCLLLAAALRGALFPCLVLGAKRRGKGGAEPLIGSTGSGGGRSGVRNAPRPRPRPHPGPCCCHELGSTWRGAASGSSWVPGRRAGTRTGSARAHRQVARTGEACAEHAASRTLTPELRRVRGPQSPPALRALEEGGRGARVRPAGHHDHPATSRASQGVPVTPGRRRG